MAYKTFHLSPHLMLYYLILSHLILYYLILYLALALFFTLQPYGNSFSFMSRSCPLVTAEPLRHRVTWSTLLPLSALVHLYSFSMSQLVYHFFHGSCLFCQQAALHGPHGCSYQHCNACLSHHVVISCLNVFSPQLECKLYLLLYPQQVLECMDAEILSLISCSSRCSREGSCTL